MVFDILFHIYIRIVHIIYIFWTVVLHVRLRFISFVLIWFPRLQQQSKRLCLFVDLTVAERIDCESDLMSAAKTRRGPPPGMGKPVNKMNQRFVWTTLQLIGYRVSLQLADGQWFTGILDHIDDSNFNVTLKMATATGVREKATKEKVVLGADICQLIAADVDTRNVAKKDLKFMTDTDISGNQNHWR